jgi:hypothetical protein
MAMPMLEVIATVRYSWRRVVGTIISTAVVSKLAVEIFFWRRAATIVLPANSLTRRRFSTTVPCMFPLFELLFIVFAVSVFLPAFFQ